MFTTRNQTTVDSISIGEDWVEFRDQKSGRWVMRFYPDEMFIWPPTSPKPSCSKIEDVIFFELRRHRGATVLHLQFMAIIKLLPQSFSVCLKESPEILESTDAVLDALPGAWSEKRLRGTATAKLW